VPGETEAGSAGRQPGRGIAWWAHRDDDRSAEAALLRSSQNHIGSVDPYALKIPARRAESCSLRRELALHFTLNRDRTSSSPPAIVNRHSWPDTGLSEFAQ